MTSIYDQLTKQDTKLPYFLLRPSPNSPSLISVAPIEAYTAEDTTIAFIDPSAQPQNPGWPLRNLLAYLRVTHPDSTKSLRVLCWRDAELPRDGWKSCIGDLTVGDGSSEITAPSSSRPNAVGWEKNVHGKLGPRMADLAPMMDPARCVPSTMTVNTRSCTFVDWRIKLLTSISN